MIIFDLDGTLADCEHRGHFVDASYRHDCYYKNPATLTQSEGWYYNDIFLMSEPPKPKMFIPDCKSFYEACDQDVPIRPTLNLLEDVILNNTDFEIWSVRCGSVREKTIKWLYYHVPLTMRLLGNTYLKMRPIGDYTPDDVLKEKWLDEAIQQGKIIDFVFDDRPKVIHMWRRRGIFVFNCCQHDQEF